MSFNICNSKRKEKIESFSSEFSLERIFISSIPCCSLRQYQLFSFYCIYNCKDLILIFLTIPVLFLCWIISDILFFPFYVFICTVLCCWFFIYIYTHTHTKGHTKHITPSFPPIQLPKKMKHIQQQHQIYLLYTT